MNFHSYYCGENVTEARGGEGNWSLQGSTKCRDNDVSYIYKAIESHNILSATTQGRYFYLSFMHEETAESVNVLTPPCQGLG